MSLAIVFPGQGSQSVGMMKGFEGIPGVERTFAEARDIVGIDYAQMVREGPAEALNQTVNTQPLMLVAGVACWRAWREKGGELPVYFAGHSLGEYSALVAAEALRFEDALPLVRFRAQAMQEAVPEGTGGIAAILGLDDAKLAEVCAEAHEGKRILEAQDLGRHQRRILAEAVTREIRGQLAALLAPRAPARHSCHQHERLRVHGLVERLRRALAHHLRVIDAHDVARLRERALHAGDALEALHHAHGLRALPRKYDR